jgi:hypothetical protein
MRRIPFIASIVPALVAGTLAWPAVASAITPPPMTVSIHSVAGVAGNYFQVSALSDQVVPAGSLYLRNPTDRPVTVLVDPVNGITSSTLGSAYHQRGARPTGAASWLALGERRVSLAPHDGERVPVTVQMGSGVRPGDYLAGISIQSAGGSGDVALHGNVAVSSVQRYGIGVEVRVPGPRRNHLRLTGVRLQRKPTATTFSLLARNDGNAILQDVHGEATITQHGHLVGRRAIGPGTFVSGTSIAYPLLFPKLQPALGDTYKVSAVMRYPGGVARINRNVKFGAVDAERQQSFGGPQVDKGHTGKLLPFILLGALLAGALLAWELRRQRSGPGALRRTLLREIAHARASGQPLSVLLIARRAGSPRQLRGGVRACLRRGDKVFHLDGGIVVVSPDRAETAATGLAAEIRRHASRRGADAGVTTVVNAAQSHVGELLEAASNLNATKPKRRGGVAGGTQAARGS